MQNRAVYELIRFKEIAIVMHDLYNPTCTSTWNLDIGRNLYVKNISLYLQIFNTKIFFEKNISLGFINS